MVFHGSYLVPNHRNMLKVGIKHKIGAEYHLKHGCELVGNIPSLRVNGGKSCNSTEKMLGNIVVVTRKEQDQTDKAVVARWKLWKTSNVLDKINAALICGRKVSV